VAVVAEELMVGPQHQWLEAEVQHTAEDTAFELEAELDKKTEDVEGKNWLQLAVWTYLVGLMQVVVLIY
jgi:hypothetical protein